MNWLINIRGAVASGKTTAVRQFCQLKGFRVETVELKDAVCCVTILGDGEIIVLGDYGNPANCTGPDRFRKKDGQSATKNTLRALVRETALRYKPRIIIFEHMLTSQLFKSTAEIAETGRRLGYEYAGYQLWRSEDSRAQMLFNRSGAMARTKNFHVNAKRVNRATELLNAGGYNVEVVNVGAVKAEDMWKVVDGAVKKAF